MNKNPTNISEALAMLQAAAQYAARPPQPLDDARSVRVQPMSKSYTKAVEEYRQWMENTKGRLDDQKNGRELRPRYKYNP
jgi:hypothetical protein